MRERLVDVLKKAPLCNKAFDLQYSDGTIEKVADYILADGWIRPPVKVGQTVYQTQPTRNRVQEYEVTAHKFNGSCYFFSWVLKDKKGFYENVEGFSEFQIGATVFLTREEAEKVLKGGAE